MPHDSYSARRARLDRDARYPPRAQRSSGTSVTALVVIVVFLGAIAGAAAVSTDTLGAGQLYERALAKIDRFVAGPVPDRSAPGTVLVTSPDEPDGPDGSDPDGSAPGPTPAATPDGPDPSPDPNATPDVSPVRVPVDMDILTDHESVFAHEIKDTWCSPAGVQMVLAILGLADTSHAFQRTLEGRVHEWESLGDSRNGAWGPSAMVLALEAYGAAGYEVRAYQSRQGALRDAARALTVTGDPVILLAWRGAHTWVMTGFQADADPTVFPDAKIAGAYILDPWYPDVSSIWGPSDPPGTFQDRAEMIRNYLPWKRPEGKYPDRDGLYISVVPTAVVSAPE